MTNLYDNGDFFVEYVSYYDWPREIVQEITGYQRLNGSPVTEKELAEQGFSLPTEEDIQHDLDRHAPWSRENLEADAGERAWKEQKY